MERMRKEPFKEDLALNTQNLVVVGLTCSKAL